MTAVGGGVLGLAHGLRTFAALIDDSAGERRPVTELSPGKEVASGGWSVHSGSVYKQAFSQTFDGVVRDVVGLESLVEPSQLTRVEQIADVVAGTYFYDPDATTPEIYLRLPDSSNPSGTTVIALLGFFIGAKGEVHAQLGADKLAGDGDFEMWAG